MSAPTRTSAFDIRLIIALLTGIYGLVLTVLGLFFTTDEDLAKSADVNINLWAGLGLLVICLLFVLWARIRPLRVPEGEENEAKAPQ
jgi:glucan phosphoethanolaminetransferase (alkaline phosphatase superfamily)